MSLKGASTELSLLSGKFIHLSDMYSKLSDLAAYSVLSFSCLEGNDVIMSFKGSDRTRLYNIHKIPDRIARINEDKAFFVTLKELGQTEVHVHYGTAEPETLSIDFVIAEYDRVVGELDKPLRLFLERRRRVVVAAQMQQRFE